MTQLLMVDKTTGFIHTSQDFKGSQGGCRCVDFDTLEVGNKPETAREMVGGHLTGTIYTKRAVTFEEATDKSLVDAFKALDPSVETGSLKVVIEYLQRLG